MRLQAAECVVQSQTRILAVFRNQPQVPLACRGTMRQSGPEGPCLDCAAAGLS